MPSCNIFPVDQSGSSSSKLLCRYLADLSVGYSICFEGVRVFVCGMSLVSDSFMFMHLSALFSL